MKKGTAVGCLILITLVSFFSGAFAAGNTTTIRAVLNKTLKIDINGSLFAPRESNGAGIYPIVYNGRTYIPLKAFCETAGIAMEADSKTNTISVTVADAGSEGNEQPDKDFSESVPPISQPKASSGSTNPESGSQESFSGQQFASGVTATKEGGGTLVQIEKGSLPEAMKGFTQISVCGTDDISDKTISKIVSETKQFHYGLMAYDEKNGYRELAKSKYLVVMLFDNGENLLGYSIIE